MNKPFPKRLLGVYVCVRLYMAVRFAAIPIVDVVEVVVFESYSLLLSAGGVTIVFRHWYKCTTEQYTRTHTAIIKRINI